MEYFRFLPRLYTGGKLTMIGNGSLSRAVLSVALFGTLAWTAPTHASNNAPVADEKTVALEIKIDKFNFMPHDTIVAVGTTVTWINRDRFTHTVVSTNGKFKSKTLDTDDKFSFTFLEPGTYEYSCWLHPKIMANAIVE
jgi:plastocyanin